MISDKKPVRDLVTLMANKGVTDVVISPGSRNAPLTISFHNHPKINCYSIVDERSAAFFALGMAQQTGRTVAVCCTSGSAAVNYAPAVVEAFYQKIPLLVITADRPNEWIDQGDGQTMRQQNLYANFIKKSYSLAQEATDRDSVWHNQRQINEAIDLAQADNKGPVHINLPLRENLYGTTEEHEIPPKVIHSPRMDIQLAQSEVSHLADKLDKAPKVLVLCGMTPKNERLEKALFEFSEKTGALVMTEASSNLHHSNYIGCIDRLLVTMSENEEQEFVPDILITIGHSIVSKKIKKHFRCMWPTEHWHVDAADEYIDTFQALTLRVPSKPETFFEQMNQETISPSEDYRDKWLERNRLNHKHGERFIEKTKFSDLKVFSQILKKLPANSLLQMGNSSVVRYVLLFDPSSEIVYNGNRGTSGIDGCTSTAMGAALGSKKETTLITGDVAFFYDSNGLWNNYLSPNLKIILINNGGGGIFRIIPGPSTSEALEPYFETHHQMDAEKLAEQFGLDYFSSENEAELSEGLDWLYSDRQRAGILEIKTPRLENDPVLKSFFKYLKDQIH